MGRRKREVPRSASADWPNAACGDPVAEEIRLIAVRLAQVRDEQGLSLRQVAELASTTHPVVAALLKGEAWPEVATIVRLEHALGVDLWRPRR